MIRFYYCASCDLSFSQVQTGVEPNVRCPICHSGKNTAKNPLRYNNLVCGLKIKEMENVKK